MFTAETLGCSLSTGCSECRILRARALSLSLCLAASLKVRREMISEVSAVLILFVVRAFSKQKAKEIFFVKRGPVCSFVWHMRLFAAEYLQLGSIELIIIKRRRAISRI